MATDEERLLIRLEAQADKMFKVLAKADAEVKARMKSIDQQFTRSNKRVTDGLTAAATSYRKAGNASGAFGAQIQNASFQVSDFAVQVASGTDASRAMAQQLPQLLGGMGVLGAVAGAAAAIAIPFAANWLAAGEDVATVEERLNALSKAISEFKSASNGAAQPVVELVSEYGAYAEQMQAVLRLQRQIAYVDASKALSAASASVFDVFGNLERMNVEGEKTPEWLREVEREFGKLNPDAVKAIEENLGVTREQAILLAHAFVALQKAEGPEAQAEALRSVIEQLEIATGGVGTMNDTVRKMITLLLDAESAALLLAAVDLVSGASAAADEYGRLAGNIRAAAEEQLRQLAIENSPGGRAMAKYGGRTTEDNRPVTDGRGYELKDGKFVDPNAKSSGTSGSGRRGRNRAENEADLVQQRIEAARAAAEAARMEAEAIFMTAEAAATAKARFELLQEAKRKNLDLDKKSAKTGLTLREAIDQQAEAIGRLTAEAEKYREKAQFMAQMNENLKNGFLDAIVEGKNFGDVLANLAKQLARAALEAALFGTGPFASIGGGGILSGLVSSIFGGFRAQGGPVQSGKAYVVGEKQPELFVPGTSGTILPTTRGAQTMGGGKTEVVLRLSPGLEAAILEQSAGQSVQIVEKFSREILPVRFKQMQRDPRRS